MSLVPRVLLVLLFALPATAQLSVDILPRAGFAGEGIGIAVQGAPLSDVTAVTFDGVPAVGPLFELAGRVYMGTPQHEPGEVEVRVTFRDGQTATTRFRYTTTDDWERILIPVQIEGPVSGAFGSRWTTDTYVSAVGQDVDFRADWCTTRFTNACPPVFYRRIAADHTSELNTRHPLGGVGSFLFVLRDELPFFAMNSWVRDLARDAEAFGTEQPVVRMREFRKQIVLAPIPNDDRFRVLLRVYGPNAHTVTARLRIHSGPNVVDDRVIEIAGNSSASGSEQFQFTPAFTQLSLDEFKSAGPLRIVLTSDVPIWAFASITNNTTQHVTLATPW